MKLITIVENQGQMQVLLVDKFISDTEQLFTVYK